MRYFQLRLLIALLLLVAASVAPAMTVRPPEFTELVEKADIVIRGEVTAVRSEWRGAGETRRIVTLVSMAVRRCLVGEAITAIELEFLGGKVGSEEMTVVGMPQFKVGDSDILFVRGNGRQMCPLVHASYGRYQVVADRAGAGATVARADGQPLTAAKEVSAPLGEEHASETQPDDLLLAAGAPQRAAMQAPPLSVEAFESEIIAQARSLGRPLPQ